MTSGSSIQTDFETLREGVRSIQTSEILKFHNERGEGFAQSSGEMKGRGRRIPEKKLDVTIGHYP